MPHSPGSRRIHVYPTWSSRTCRTHLLMAVAGPADLAAPSDRERRGAFLILLVRLDGFTLLTGRFGVSTGQCGGPSYRRTSRQPHQFRTRNGVNKPLRTPSNSNKTAAKSTNLIDSLPLITVWLQIRCYSLHQESEPYTQQRKPKKCSHSDGRRGDGMLSRGSSEHHCECPSSHLI